MNLAATIAKMRAAGFTAEDIVAVLECIDLDPSAMRVSNSPQRANSGAKAGPRERWGYTGPITPRLPEREWWPLRMRILVRDEFVCKYCGIEGEEEAQWCADHVIPLSRGGTNDEDNLVACCVPCNNSKGDRLLSEWRGRGK